MSLAKQFQQLGKQAATFRQSLFGATAAGTSLTADYNHGEIPALAGYYSPIKTRQQTEEAGFFELHDCVFRVIKANAPSFIPEIDKHLLIEEGKTEILLRIDEIAGTHPLSREWILGCKAQN